MIKNWHNAVKVMCIIFVLASLLGCSGAAEPISTRPVDTPGTGCPSKAWTILKAMNFDQPTISVMFLNGSLGISTDLAGGIYYTEDSGASWTYATKSGLSRVALEMNGGMIWHVGFGGSVTRSSDDGHTWQVLSSLPHGGHIEYMSFADEMTGWTVTTELREFFVTRDGARTWTRLPFPEGMGRPAAIHLRTPLDGFLLDTAGNLYVTKDGGVTWEARSLHLPEGSVIPVLNHSAAMRFVDEEHGFVALNLLAGGAGRVLGLRTGNGGDTWSEESLPVPMGMFHLTRDEGYLTHVDLIDQGKITLLCSNKK
jgi:hypothetical protein